MQMLFQACQVLYSNQSVWTDDRVYPLTQSLDSSSSDDSCLQPVLSIVDCMINVSLHQVSRAAVVKCCLCCM